MVFSFLLMGCSIFFAVFEKLSGDLEFFETSSSDIGITSHWHVAIFVVTMSSWFHCVS